MRCSGGAHLYCAWYDADHAVGHVRLRRRMAEELGRVAGEGASRMLADALRKDMVQPSWSSTSTGYYFNIRSVDNAGNWDSSSSSTGPYLIDTLDPTEATNPTSSTHVANAWSNEMFHHVLKHEV